MMNFEFIAAAADGGGGAKKLAKVSGIAYNGGTLNVGWGYPVVIDLAGLEIPQTAPLLVDHANKVASRIGSISASTDGKRLDYTGEITSESEIANEVITQAKNGANWNNSVGVDPTSYRFIEEKETVKANGQAFTGPIYYLESGKLKEISVVPIGADDKTEMTVEATFKLGECTMGKEMTKPGEAPEKTVAAGSESPAIQAANAEAGNKPVQASVDPSVVASAVDAALAKKDKEMEIRAAAIREIFGEEFPEVMATCISSTKMTVEAASKEYAKAVRASMPKLNIVIAGGKDNSAPVIEAAALSTLGMSDDKLSKSFKPETIDAAHKNFRGGIGLQQMLMIAAAQNGYVAPTFRGYEADILRAAFSSLEIGGILSNVANKSILNAFTYVEQAWREVSKVGSVADFKQITRYRMTGDLEFRKVGAGGEIESGSLGEESYTNQADTYGRLLKITRQDLINDDLGALNDSAALIGRGAVLGLNKVFWTEFNDNAAFFTAGRGNLGTTSALSVDNLTTAVKLFLSQTDANGDPLGIVPAILLVPPGLSYLAERLYKDANVENADAKKTATTGNGHAGKYRPVTSAYLDNARIPGGSATTWYLLADPMALPVIETVFLNGQQTPTVSTAEAEFSTLGIQMRGFFDFGVKKQDYRGGAKFTA